MYVVIVQSASLCRASVDFITDQWYISIRYT